jgi:2-oxoglutarate ferredoxin oxidoreductase subunit alpha
MAGGPQTALKADRAAEGESVVNDFQIIVATVNGTGSQTANSTLIRALFKMGIPINGKNIFPSNIQGLPTWFIIRLSKDGYISRRENSEVLIAMNQATVVDDIRNLPAGGICLVPDDWKVAQDREDITYYPMPVKALMGAADIPSSLKDYVVNMIYVGFLAHLLGIDLAAIEDALKYHFGGREKPIKLNMDMVIAAYDWARENVAPQERYRVEPMNATQGMILMDGNSAGALGAIFGGVTFAAWYPITPSTSLADALNDYLSELRVDQETGKATYAVVQAEDELAAIGMVVGAGWAGARAMTATSGPGISLMSEFAGMAYFAEIPSVIWDIQRMGPSTGLPTRTSQGDVLAAYLCGHGDTQHIVLFPANLAEAFEFGWRSFDIAERIQTLVFVLSDLDLGMNLWMSHPFEYPTEPMDRGKVLSAEDLDRLGEWGRYRDVDDDGIGYRTLPGTKHRNAAYFTRGTGHNADARYSERADDWVENMERLRKKFDTARGVVPQPIVDTRGSKLGLISYGTNDSAIIEARDRLRSQGVETDYLRIRALPLNDTTRIFIEQHDNLYVIENNTDGQMYKLLCMDYPDLAPNLKSLALSDGLPLSARWLVNTLMDHEGVMSK